MVVYTKTWLLHGQGYMGDGVPICSSVHFIFWQEHIFECINLFRWSCRYPWTNCLPGTLQKSRINFCAVKWAIIFQPSTTPNPWLWGSGGVPPWTLGVAGFPDGRHFHLPTWVFQTSGRSTDLPAVSILLTTSFRKFLGLLVCPRFFLREFMIDKNITEE